MFFEDAKPIRCDWCRDLVYPGQIAITWRGGRYCSGDCVRDAMYDTLASEVDEEPVLTAADKAEIYVDMQKEDEYAF